MQQALRDEIAEKGLKDGSWMWMKDGEGNVNELPTEHLVEFYGSPDFPGAKFNYRWNADGSKELVLIQPEQLYVDWGNGPEPVQGWKTYTNMSGQKRFVTEGPDGLPVNTSTLPWEGLDEYDDGFANSPSGTIGYEDANGVWRTEPVYEVVGDSVRFSARFQQVVLAEYATQALGWTFDETRGVWLDADGGEHYDLGDQTKVALSWGVSNANVIWGDDDTTPERSWGFEPIEVQKPNPDYVPPLRDRLGTMTVAEIKEELTPEQWEQFKAEVDRLPGSSLPNKLRTFQENSFKVGGVWAKDIVITNLYENPSSATFGGADDPAIQEAAVEARQGVTDEDVESLMMRDNAERVLELRKTVEEFGEDATEGQQAAQELNDLRIEAKRIATDNIASGVDAQGNPVQRTETTGFGGEGDTIDPGELASATAFEGGNDGERGQPFLTETVEPPKVFVLNDTGTTSDERDILGQFQSPLGRAQLAAMTPDQQRDILYEVVKANGEENNPDFIYAIANEIDALTAAGKHGGDEEYYVSQSGSMSDDERFRRIREARFVANASRYPTSLAAELEPSLYADLKAANWTDAQIRAKHPEVVAEHEAIMADRYSALPSSVPGLESSYKPSSAILNVDGALRNATQAFRDTQTGIVYPQGTAPKVEPLKVNPMPVSTLRGSTKGGIGYPMGTQPAIKPQQQTQPVFNTNPQPAFQPSFGVTTPWGGAGAGSRVSYPGSSQPASQTSVNPTSSTQPWVRSTSMGKTHVR
jgi:hypothetical protein